jgi:hypothetical protein
MRSRAQALELVEVGDLIFGLGAGGQEKLLLVYKTDTQGFSARHVTTQMTFRFDRNGNTRIYADGGHITIASTAKLPPELDAVARSLDSKYAARPEYPASVLTKAEINLLLTYASIYKAEPLPLT